jgi:hypothetical protein
MCQFRHMHLDSDGLACMGVVYHKASPLTQRRPLPEGASSFGSQDKPAAGTIFIAAAHHTPVESPATEVGTVFIASAVASEPGWSTHPPQRSWVGVISFHRGGSAVADAMNTVPTSVSLRTPCNKVTHTSFSWVRGEAPKLVSEVRDLMQIHQREHHSVEHLCSFPPRQLAEGQLPNLDALAWPLFCHPFEIHPRFSEMCCVAVIIAARYWSLFE